MTILSTLLLQWGPHHPTGPGGPMAPQGPMGPGGGFGAGTMPWGAGWTDPMAILLLALLVVLAVLVAAVLVPRLQTATAETDEANTILRQRYAQGEIDQEEFERRRSILEGQPT